MSRDKEGKANFLRNRLNWHYAKIVEIGHTRGQSACLRVPDGERFLQNGFDGWNSKGLEFHTVYLASANQGVLPHIRGERDEEQRLCYVAVSRAKDRLVVCSYQEPSEFFLREFGVERDVKPEVEVA